MAHRCRRGAVTSSEPVSTLEHETGHEFTDIRWQDVHDPMLCDTDASAACKREATRHFDWEERVSTVLKRWMEDPDGVARAVREYKQSKWKPRGGGVVTVTLPGATGRPVPWRPVQLCNKRLGEERTDVTDHAGRVAIPGEAAADIPVRNVWTGVGNSAADGRVVHAVA